MAYRRIGRIPGDLLAEKAKLEGKPAVMVLNNAPFRKAGAVGERRPGWEARKLKLYYLPSYCVRT